MLEKRLNIKDAGYVWATQFNDLRERSPKKAQTVSELKKIYLFNDQLIVRDSDLVNHPDLLNTLINHPGIIRERALIPALRDSTESYFELNEKASRNRAFPEKYDDVKDALELFDSKLAIMSKSINQPIIASLPSKIITDHFDVLVNRIANGYSTNRPINGELINKAKEYARATSSEELLSFGLMYEWLTKKAKLTYKSNEIQCLRLAHNLVVPIESGVSVNVSDSAIRKEWIDVLRPTGTENTDDFGKTYDFDFDQFRALIPRIIPVESTLTSLPFETIRTVRREEVRNGNYFKALNKVQNEIVHTDNIFPLIEEYLISLKEYLRRIEMNNSKVYFVDWHSEVEKSIDQKIDSLSSSWLQYGIPYAYRSAGVALSAGVIGSLCTIVPDMQLWHTVIAMSAGAAINPLGPFFADKQKDDRKGKLDKAKELKNMIKEDLNCRAKECF